MSERDCKNCIWHTEDGCSSWGCDFISREEVAEAVKKLREERKDGCPYYCELLPGTEKQCIKIRHEWVPVTERLPGKFQTCIVTDEWRQCAYEYDYDPENEFTKRYGWRYNGRKIIAWMPLPEPYTEVEP